MALRTASITPVFASVPQVSEYSIPTLPSRVGLQQDSKNIASKSFLVSDGKVSESVKELLIIRIDIIHVEIDGARGLICLRYRDVSERDVGFLLVDVHILDFIN